MASHLQARDRGLADSIRARAVRLSLACVSRGLAAARFAARFSASCGCGCVCAVERVQNRPDLHMSPYSATSCAHIALVELGGNSVVAGYAASPNFLDDGADVGCKPPCIGFQSRPAAFCNLGY